MRAKKEGKCPLCRRHERYSAEYNLYTCPNAKCKLNHFWFSEAEWSRLCRTTKVRYGTEKAEAVWRATKANGESSLFVHESSARAWAGENGNVELAVDHSGPAEVTTLDELEAAQRFGIPFVIPKPDHTEQPLEMVTLRDRFAMAALTGLIAINDYEPLDLITKTSFSIADECMKQRKAQGGVSDGKKDL